VVIPFTKKRSKDNKNSISGKKWLTRPPSARILRRMIVIGLQKLPQAEAEKRFGAAFTFFLRELQQKRWTNLPDFLRFYPRARRGDDGTVLIPLDQDGSGIVSAVSFDSGIVRLLRIALAAHASRHSSLPRNETQPHSHTAIP